MRNQELNRLYQAKWYAANREKQILRVAVGKRRLREWFRKYKATCKCQKCGQDHPAAIDFHHKDKAKKEMTLANIIHVGWSIERVKTELRKCIPLCAVCHRIFHYEELNSGITLESFLND